MVLIAACQNLSQIPTRISHLTPATFAFIIYSVNIQIWHSELQPLSSLNSFKVIYLWKNLLLISHAVVGGSLSSLVFLLRDKIWKLFSQLYWPDQARIGRRADI